MRHQTVASMLPHFNLSYSCTQVAKLKRQLQYAADLKAQIASNDARKLSSRSVAASQPQAFLAQVSHTAEYTATAVVPIINCSTNHSLSAIKALATHKYCGVVVSGLLQSISATLRRGVTSTQCPTCETITQLPSGRCGRCSSVGTGERGARHAAMERALCAAAASHSIARCRQPSAAGLGPKRFP